MNLYLVFMIIGMAQLLQLIRKWETSLFNKYFLFKVALEVEEVEVVASEEEEEVVDSEVSMRKMPLNNWICSSMLSVRFFPFRFISLPTSMANTGMFLALA